MGLDPILLLEKPPTSEKYTVRIITSGEKGDGDNNKNLIRLENNNPIGHDTINLEEIKNTKEEEEKEETNLDLEEEKNNLISSEKITINETNELNLTENKEADEDPRRKRRRSSAVS